MNLRRGPISQPRAIAGLLLPCRHGHRRRRPQTASSVRLRWLRNPFERVGRILRLLSRDITERDNADQHALTVDNRDPPYLQALHHMHRLVYGSVEKARMDIG